MIETHLNLFDATVLGILALSCLFAFFRGFVREILSLGAWIGAAIVTMYYFPVMAAYLKPHFKSAIAATGIGTLIVYVGSLIGFSIINAVIIKFVKTGKDIGMLDNTMGFFYGLARGAFIISLGYFLLTIALPEKEYPDWLKKSLTQPYAEKGAIYLAKIAPEYLREISTLEKRAVEEAQEQQQKSGVANMEDDTSKEVNKVSNRDSGGYNRAGTSQLERLINGTEKK